MFSSVPREPPRPFTSNIILNTSDYAELAVWHNLLPMRGYLANYTKEESQMAAKHCRTLLYFHGNAENRNKQVCFNANCFSQNSNAPGMEAGLVCEEDWSECRDLRLSGIW